VTFFTQDGSGQRLSPVHVLMAFLIAWLLPTPVGFALSLLGSVWAVKDGGLVFVVGFVLTYAPIFSWIGLIPGAMVYQLAWRKGYGSLLACVGIGLGIGVALSSVVGFLALIMSAPLSALYWVALQHLSGGALRSVSA